MASTTPNIGLTLPTGAEKVSRQIINNNNTKIDTAIGTLNGNFVSAAVDMSGTMQQKFQSIFTIINGRNYATDKSYPVMLYISGSTFNGTFTGTFNISSGGIRFLVADETRVIHGLFRRSDNTILNIEDLNSKLPKTNSFVIACQAGQNIFNKNTMTLVSGSLPSAQFNQCIFMVTNHASNQNSPNTIEADGQQTLIINAKTAQNLTVRWLDVSML